MRWYNEQPKVLIADDSFLCTHVLKQQISELGLMHLTEFFCNGEQIAKKMIMIIE